MGISEKFEKEQTLAALPGRVKESQPHGPHSRRDPYVSVYCSRAIWPLRSPDNSVLPSGIAGK